MLDDINIKFAKLMFTRKVRNRVYRKLNRFLSNGVSLTRALDILWGHASDDGRKPGESLALVLDHWRRMVNEGRPFGQAIKGWVPESDRLVIEGGEKAGNLSIAIEKAISINESSGKIKMTVIKGMAYPITLFGAALALLIMIVRNVVPAFDLVLPRENWTGIGGQMASVANLVDNYLYWTLGLLGVLIILISASMSRWTGNLRTRFDRYPPWSVYRLVMGSGFMLTVSGMIRAGIPLPTTLEMLSRDAEPWYKDRVGTALEWVDEGFNLGEALHKAGHNFPDKESVQDLRAYAELNKFDESLERLGTEWLAESVEKIEIQTSVLKNISMLMLGATLLWTYLGIYSLQTQISASIQ